MVEEETAKFYLKKCLNRYVIILRGGSPASSDFSHDVDRENDFKIANYFEELIEATSMIRFEEKLKEMANLRNIFEERTYVIRSILVAVYLRNIGDSSIVGEILKCTGIHPEMFILRTLIYARVQVKPSVAEKIGVSFTSYLLHHANEAQTLINTKRLVELCAITNPEIYSVGFRRMASCKTICVRTRRISSYINLVQYGGRLGDRENITDAHHVPIVLIDTLSGIIQAGAEENLWDQDTLIFEEPLKMNDQIKGMCLCFRLLLADTTNPHKATFLLAGKNGLHGPIPHLDVLIPFYEKLFPKCKYGRKIPPTLLHMSRHVIRTALYENWKLPNGIQSLEIPPVLKDYLNLLHD